MSNQLQEEEEYILDVLFEEKEDKPETIIDLIKNTCYTFLHWLFKIN